MKLTTAILLYLLGTGCSSMNHQAHGNDTACVSKPITLERSVAELSSGIRSILDAAADLASIPSQVVSLTLPPDAETK